MHKCNKCNRITALEFNCSAAILELRRNIKFVLFIHWILTIATRKKHCCPTFGNGTCYTSWYTWYKIHIQHPHVCFQCCCQCCQCILVRKSTLQLFFYIFYAFYVWSHITDWVIGGMCWVPSVWSYWSFYTSVFLTTSCVFTNVFLCQYVSI